MASSSPTHTSKSLLVPLAGHSQSGNISTECSICQETYTSPKVLPCLHTFCLPCLEKQGANPESIQCPECAQVCALPPQGLSGVPYDYAANNFLAATSQSCTSCRTKDKHAVAHCKDCPNNLCEGCVLAHQNMHCFADHEVVNLTDQSKEDFKIEKLLVCLTHRNKLQFFCKSCDVPVCKDCIRFDHPEHRCDEIIEVGPREVEKLVLLLEQSKAKTVDLTNIAKSMGPCFRSLQMQYSKAEAEISATFDFYVTVLKEYKEELHKKLESLYHAKMLSLSLLNNNVAEGLSKVNELSVFVNRLMQYSTHPEILMQSSLIAEKLQSILDYNPEFNVQSLTVLEFLSNFSAIQVGVKNTFGYIRHNPEGMQTPPEPKPIARPNGLINSNHVLPFSEYNPINNVSERFGSSTSLGSFSTSDFNSYEQWSSGPVDVYQSRTTDSFQSNTEAAPVIELASKLMTARISPPLSSQIQRKKMIYHCKFGEFGVMEGQFTEPSGVAVNSGNDIIAVDTNNHRCQIFDKEGRFKFHFGECGKGDGQLMYPNRVTVIQRSGDIIVTERSPTHQIQIYNQYGQFVRKFGANILQHPRAVTVDNKLRIIVVECKVMRVIIFDLNGNVINQFGCSKYLQFPNGVVVNDKQEIFISDNRAHCVKVFNYEGVFLRQIGGERLTNYPIGVCMTHSGEILVADNHNNFNITIFTQDGQLLSASESKVKHAQCFDVALMDDGSVVLASKDYRLYIYRYLQIPGVTY